MVRRVKIGRGIGTGVALAALMLVAQTGVALANGVGDLYVATRDGVVEVHVVTSQVVNTVPIVPPPTALAFSPDGKSLFVASDATRIVRIDIATLDTDEPISMPGIVTALAFPSGQYLVGTIPSDDRLVFLRIGGSVTESEALPGTPNLIAGDRHDPRVAAAEAGESWLAVADPSTAEIRTTELSGEIRALAIDRDTKGVLVATANPDAVVRVDLANLAVAWTAPLDAPPVAVAALDGLRVAATKQALWSVSADGAKRWAKPGDEVSGLTASDEGRVLHAIEPDGVEVFDQAGASQRVIALTGDRAPLALAAVPAGSSLFTGANHTGTGTGASPSKGPGSTGSGTGEPPVTSTIAEGVERLFAERSIQGAAIVALSILVACWFTIHWLERRRARG